jgi:hypothetical protein
LFALFVVVVFAFVVVVFAFVVVVVDDDKFVIFPTDASKLPDSL